MVADSHASSLEHICIGIFPLAISDVRKKTFKVATESPIFRPIDDNIALCLSFSLLLLQWHIDTGNFTTTRRICCLAYLAFAVQVLGILLRQES